MGPRAAPGTGPPGSCVERASLMTTPALEPPAPRRTGWRVEPPSDGVGNDLGAVHAGQARVRGRRAAPAGRSVGVLPAPADRVAQVVEQAGYRPGDRPDAGLVRRQRMWARRRDLLDA